MKKCITHLVCGFPSREESRNILFTLAKYSEYIEIQFPFSDPIADGETISQANDISLKNGMTPEVCFDFIEDTIHKVSSKYIIMTYFNIVYHYGIEQFIKRSKALGVYGCIIPDLPYDEVEGKEMLALCERYDFHFIFVVSPNISDERLSEISTLSTGFVYAISKNMTTGNEIEVGTHFSKYIARIKKATQTEVGVGFGIKTRDQVQKVLKDADFAIIGSELMKQYEQGGIVGLERYMREVGE